MLKLVELIRMSGVDLGNYKIHCATDNKRSEWRPLEQYYCGTFELGQSQQSQKNFECDNLPAIKILNPEYERASGFLMLAMLSFFCIVLISFWVSFLWIPFLVVVFMSIAWVNHVARHSQPTSVTFGELKTIRDLCRSLAPGIRT